MDLRQEIEIINIIKKGSYRNLKLDFITDQEEIKEKMRYVRNPTKLINFSIRNIKPHINHPCIDSYPIESYFDDNMLELIKFVEAGNKLVPPVLLHLINYLDGIEQADPQLQPHDGSHRSILAYFLGYKEIPFIINRIESHAFSFSKNDFSVNEEELTVTSIEGKKMSFMLDSYSVYVDRENGKIKVEAKLR